MFVRRWKSAVVACLLAYGAACMALPADAAEGAARAKTSSAAKGKKKNATRHANARQGAKRTGVARRAVTAAPALAPGGQPRPAALKVSAPGASANAAMPGLRSNVALVIDQTTGETVIAKNIDDVQPVASITKLMTALVVLDAQLALTKQIQITEEDVDTERGSRSRLKVGAELSRNDLLHLALMSSENRAAHALGRTYPDGLPAFIDAMNAKARELGMVRTRFVDPTGLSSANVSTAADLVKLVRATHNHNLIRQYSTGASHQVTIDGRPKLFHNTNRLVVSDNWDIGLSKTGFINEAGRCLVMQARIQGRPMVIVLLDSWGKLSRIGDANRIKKWLTSGAPAGTVAG